MFQSLLSFTNSMPSIGRDTLEANSAILIDLAARFCDQEEAHAKHPRTVGDHSVFFCVSDSVFSVWRRIVRAFPEPDTTG
jgi:hypothetical protein